MAKVNEKNLNNMSRMGVVRELAKKHELKRLRYFDVKGFPDADGRDIAYVEVTFNGEHAPVRLTIREALMCQTVELRLSREFVNG